MPFPHYYRACMTYQPYIVSELVTAGLLGHSCNFLLRLQTLASAPNMACRLCTAVRDPQTALESRVCGMHLCSFGGLERQAF